MKLPFDFGIRFVLRLAAPGALLAAVSLPGVRRLTQVIYPGLGDAVLFATAGLIFGFALLLLDMPIYMALEGRRYWPAWLRSWGVGRQQARLNRLQARADAASEPVRVEYDLKAGQYPVDSATSMPVARFPTRLGNVLASFETYPTVKYGLDGVFFWPRLWVTIDKDLREELDSAQAVVDGAVYASAAFAISAIICLAYWIAGLSPVWWHWLVGAIACLTLSRLVYLAALPRYVQYGELFEAVFDQFRGKLNTGSLVADLDAHAQLTPAPARTDREQGRVAWRFLRWHRYRRPGTSANEVVRGW